MGGGPRSEPDAVKSEPKGLLGADRPTEQNSCEVLREIQVRLSSSSDVPDGPAQLLNQSGLVIVSGGQIVGEVTDPLHALLTRCMRIGFEYRGSIKTVDGSQRTALFTMTEATNTGST